jgi:hypothetical protein
MAIFRRPAATTLTAQLGEVQKQLNDLRARRAGLTATAETEEAYSQLAAMGAQIDVLVAKEARVRGEIAAAVEHERLITQDKAFDAAAAIISQATEAGAELVQAVAGVWPAVRKLIDLDDAVRAAVPVRPPDWDEHAFTRDLISLILAEFYVASDGRLRGPAGLLQSPQQLAQNPLFTIKGALAEHLKMAMKARPSTHAAVSTSATGGEAVQQGE